MKCELTLDYVVPVASCGLEYLADVLDALDLRTQFSAYSMRRII